MVKDLMPYRMDKELLRMLMDPVKKTEYEIQDALDEEVIYQMSLRSAESYLLIIWKILHGLPMSSLDNASDFEVTNYFYQTSKLWFRTEVAPVESDLFIGRFLSEVSLYLTHNLDKIVVDYVIHATKDIKVMSKITMLDQVILCFANLAKNMICGKMYKEESDKLFEMATMCADGGMKRRVRLINVYNEQMRILRETSKNGILGTDFVIEDSILINNIVLLAYMMVTEDVKADNMFSINPKISFSDEVSVKNVVFNLGKKILEYKDFVIQSRNMRFAKDTELAGLYQIFIRCKPKFSYRYENLQRDTCLREGCRALSYLGFLSQSKVVHRILERMIY